MYACTKTIATSAKQTPQSNSAGRIGGFGPHARRLVELEPADDVPLMKTRCSRRKRIHRMSGSIARSLNKRREGSSRSEKLVQVQRPRCRTWSSRMTSRGLRRRQPSHQSMVMMPRRSTRKAPLSSSSPSLQMQPAAMVNCTSCCRLSITALRNEVHA